jgi:hypothetical protein
MLGFGSASSIWLLLDVQRAVFGKLLTDQRAVFVYYLTFSEQYLVIT